MFLETKRDGETTDKPDIYALPTLIAWLEKQPADKAYDFTAPDRCLVAQYLKRFDVLEYSLHSWRLRERFGKPIYDAVYADGCRNSWTFGAALARARELAAHAEGRADS